MISQSGKKATGRTKSLPTLTSSRRNSIADQSANSKRRTSRNELDQSTKSQLLISSDVQMIEFNHALERPRVVFDYCLMFSLVN
jgi:hypothetical protein